MMPWSRSSFFRPHWSPHSLLRGFHRGAFAARCLRITSFTVLLIVCGCHSATVETTIDNQSSSALRLFEVNYPSASFGTGLLAAHSQFHYRFKIQGAGAIKMQYVDAANQTRNVTGPELQEGQQGSLTITISAAGEVSWKPLLTTRR